MSSAVSLDAYDALGINLDASPEEVKKGYKRMSLMYHPDKAVSLGVVGSELTDKFNEIKEASEILGDAERRKAYDTFGVDLGEERVETEAWALGANFMWSPIASFFLPSVISRVVLWLVSWRLIGGLVLLLGLVYAGLFAANFTYAGVSMRDPELVMTHVATLVICLLVFFQWVWAPLADAMVIVYMASDILGAALLFYTDWRLTAGAGFLSLFVAWLLEGRWLWVIGFEVSLAVIMLIALMIATGIMKLWLDTMHDRHAEKVMKWRTDMRKERKRLNEEVVALRRQVREAASG